MLKMLNFLICFLICFFCVIQISASKESVGSDYRVECDITEIDGQVVTTSCKLFTVGEEMEITDISGRPLLFNDIPIPCSAEIKYTCVSDENCAYIKSIMVLQEIKAVPE